MKKYLAETIGTFALVFCGTGAIVINQESSGVVTHAGIAFTFGLIITVMIYTFGNTSGAHFNPAVTISLFVAKVFPLKEVGPYIISQVLGAFIATLALKFLFPLNEMLGTTQPSGSAMQSFILEAILTFMLVLVILMVAKGNKEQAMFAGIVIGSVILLEAMFAGPICGASMNPARSLAPAIVSGHTENLWVYLGATTLGGIIAAFAWKILKPESV